MIFLRKSFWSTMVAYWLISSVECRRVSSNNRVSSSNTPIFVEVEPGLIIKLLMDIMFSSYSSSAPSWQYLSGRGISVRLAAINFSGH